MKCPVCNNESTNNICPVCGYALNMDLLYSRFLNKLSPKEIEEYKSQISIHRKIYLKSKEDITTNKTLSTKTDYTQNELDIAQQYFNRGREYYKNNEFLKAKENFEISAKHGKALAYFYLALIYEFGKGVNINYEKAFEYYRLSAELGSKIALKYMGDMYFRGNGVKQSKEKGLEMYNKAIQSQDEWALYTLGTRYYFGIGCLKQDYHKAREIFEKDISTEKTISLSYYYLAEIYEKGLGVPVDYIKAKQYRNQYERMKA